MANNRRQSALRGRQAALITRFDSDQQRLVDLSILVLIVACAMLLYGHTLHAPNYFDDVDMLPENFLQLDILGRRGVFQLSYFLNYRLFGPSAPAFHAVNIAIHAGAAFVVYLILRRMIECRKAALLGALLFVAHPLQTQAVTYLVQRATSLAGLFFLLAIYAWWRAREALSQGLSPGTPRYLVPYGAALCCGALAVFTKENAATLPLVILAGEKLFPLRQRGSWKHSLLVALPFCIAPLGLAVELLLAARGGTELSLYSDLVTLRHNSPLHYLATQFQVLWLYLRLFFLPYGQALEHNYPVAATLLNLKSLLGLAGLLALGWSAWRVRVRRPLLTFGVTWFFMTLLVESSVIPLDPLFEHRLYLPLFGLVLATLDGVRALTGEKTMLWIMGVAVLCCAPLTWQRNELWNDPIAFYEDNLSKVPTSERVMTNLANHYAARGRTVDAQRLLEQALQVNPGSPVIRTNLAGMHLNQGRTGRAVELLAEGIRLNPSSDIMYEQIASLHMRLNQPQLAIDYLEKGIAASPKKGTLLNNLGIAYLGTGRWAEAEKALRLSLKQAPDSAQVRDNLGEALIRQGRWSEAAAELRRAAEGAPDDVRLLRRTGLAALRAGDRATAQWTVTRLSRLDPAVAEEILQAMNRP